MSEYEAMMRAMRIINTARLEQDLISPENPAWMMLVHAERHLGAQAKLILRGE